MPARALSPASAPTTAPSFSVNVLTLLRLALALVLKGLAFLGGLASLGGHARARNGLGAEHKARMFCGRIR